MIKKRNNINSLLLQVDVDGSGFLEFPEFCSLMYKKLSDTDLENELKETFRVFSKDNEGETIPEVNWAVTDSVINFESFCALKL